MERQTGKICFAPGFAKKAPAAGQAIQDVESLWREIGDNAPENVRLIPDFLDGKSTYALEMLDENGDTMQVYMTEEGVLLRLSNGKLLDKPLTPTEAAQKIAVY